MIEQRVKAKLTRAANPFYRYNVLIEALPDYERYNNESVLSCMHEDNPQLMQDPRAMSLMDAEQKISLLKTCLASVFVALPRHMFLFRTIDDLIRVGYLRRKPLDRRALYEASIRYDHNGEPINFDKEKEPQGSPDESGEPLIEGYEYAEPGAPKYVADKNKATPCLGGTTPAVSLIGWSGIGKTYSINRILSLYPQVIEHPRGDITLAFTQVVWLKVECPSKTSPKSLCTAILQELDDIVGTSYREQITQRMTLDHVRHITVKALKTYYVGLLIIDEIQNIIGQDQQTVFFNFIVELTNTIKSSLMFVGTPKIEKFLNKDFRTKRRFCSAGALNWGPLSIIGKEPIGSEFSIFFKGLNKYNLVGDLTPEQSNELMNEFFNCSQGISDILVKLFFLTQIQCLLRGVPLSTQAVRNTFDMYFGSMKPVIEAVKNKNYSYLEKYSDLAMTEEEYEQHAGEALAQLEEKINSQSAKLQTPDEAAHEALSEGAQALAEKMNNMLKEYKEISGDNSLELVELFTSKLMEDPNFAFPQATELVLALSKNKR